MSDSNTDLASILQSAEMHSAPDAARRAAVRSQMETVMQRAGRRRKASRTALVAALLVVAVGGIGLTATHAGRQLLRWLFVPVETAHVTQWDAPDDTLWTQSRSGGESFSAAEQQAAADQFSETHALQQAGEGRLTGIIEGPAWTGGVSNVYVVEYTLASGETISVGGGRPTGLQAERMQIDEIQQLRDSGAGEIVSERPFSIGLGLYTIRFALSNGEVTDLQAHFPPSTAAERAAIFEETRTLKQALQFTVLRPERAPEDPLSGVWALLRYELADGRTVGFTERVPDELLSADGAYVVLPETGTSIEIEGGAR